jgi:hypothetical protein
MGILQSNTPKNNGINLKKEGLDRSQTKGFEPNDTYLRQKPLSCRRMPEKWCKDAPFTNPRMASRNTTQK